MIQIEDRMDTFFDGFLDIASCTESVLIKLLRNYPDAAIVFLEMRTAVIPRKSGAVLHMGAAQHYQVPVISYEQAVFPGYLRVLEATRDHHYTRPINDTVFGFPHGCHDCDLAGMDDEDMRKAGCQSVCDFQRWTVPWDEIDCVTPPAGREPCYVPFLAHDEVHPSGIGHKIMTDLLIDAIATTGLDLCRQQQQQQRQQLLQLESGNNNNGDGVGGGDTKRTMATMTTLLDEPAVMPRVGWMTPNPLLLDAQTDFLWVNDTYQMFNQQVPLESSTRTDGFELLEDRYDRWGWIATDRKGGQSITFEMKLFGRGGGDDGDGGGGGCYIPYLAVLKSYEGMGKMTVTVEDRFHDHRIHRMDIDGQWEPRISVPSDVQLIGHQNEAWEEPGIGCSGDCSVTVTTHPQIPGRKGNKVKILTLSVRPCLPPEVLDD